MPHSLRGKTAIVGVGHGGLGDAPGRTELEILAEAAHNALEDAGLKLSEVDGLFTGTAAHSMPTLSVGEYLGIRPRFSDGTNVGGSAFVGFILTAALALEAGLCDVALIAYGSNLRTGTASPVGSSETWPYEVPYRPRNPITPFALAAARHMYQFGTTRKQLAEVAVAARKWAQLNPEAYVRDPLTIDEVLNSRMVCDPLTVRDCCLVTDGGGAFVMVRAERAKELKQKPVYLLGAAAAHWHRNIPEMPDVTTTAATESGSRAFEMAGVDHNDVDVVQLYDAFTINPILFLEDLGFCEKGEGGSFVSNGNIAPGGKLPVNTNGGGLSFAHPGRYGAFLVIEAVRQLRGSAGERQVPGAEIALAHGNGGYLGSQITAILGTESTT